MRDLALNDMAAYSGVEQMIVVRILSSELFNTCHIQPTFISVMMEEYHISGGGHEVFATKRSTPFRRGRLWKDTVAARHLGEFRSRQAIE